MKNKNFDVIFGNQDRGLKTLIESQAQTEDKLAGRKEEPKVKKIRQNANLQRPFRQKNK